MLRLQEKSQVKIESVDHVKCQRACAKLVNYEGTARPNHTFLTPKIHNRWNSSRIRGEQMRSQKANPYKEASSVLIYLINIYL